MNKAVFRRWVGGISGLVLLISGLAPALAATTTSIAVARNADAKLIARRIEILTGVKERVVAPSSTWDLTPLQRVNLSAYISTQITGLAVLATEVQAATSTAGLREIRNKLNGQKIDSLIRPKVHSLIELSIKQNQLGRMNKTVMREYEKLKKEGPKDKPSIARRHANLHTIENHVARLKKEVDRTFVELLGTVAGDSSVKQRAVLKHADSTVDRTRNKIRQLQKEL